MEPSSKLHIAMFPWFAYGHINPFIQLSNKLSSHAIQISFFSIPGNIDRIKSSLNHSSPNQIIPLTIPPIEGLSPNFDSSSDVTPQTAQLLRVALDQMQPQVKALLSQLQPQLALIDFAYDWLPSLASELAIKTVFFSGFPAVINSYLTIPSRMTDPTKPPTVEDLKTPPQGYPTKTSASLVKSFEAQDYKWLFTRFQSGEPSAYERIMSSINRCDAIIYRTCIEIEGSFIHYFKTQVNKPVFLAGPSVPLPPTGEVEEKWGKWLSKFDKNSVIFCNFGSETSLNDSQIKQLTLGLELTGLPFLLVLNFGTSNIIDAQNKLETSLPERFLKRVRNRGVVHTGWLQQQHILAHKSIGCFLTHSGFSSIIEGIVSDCELVFLPLKADQFMNSKLFSGDLKVGVEVNRRDEDGYFGKEDILEAIKTVMVDIDAEPATTIRKNRDKWRKFFLNEEVEANYVSNLVDELAALGRKV